MSDPSARYQVELQYVPDRPTPSGSFTVRNPLACYELVDTAARPARAIASLLLFADATMIAASLNARAMAIREAA